MWFINRFISREKRKDTETHTNHTLVSHLLFVICVYINICMDTESCTLRNTLSDNNRLLHG